MDIVLDSMRFVINSQVLDFVSFEYEYIVLYAINLPVDLFHESRIIESMLVVIGW